MSGRGRGKRAKVENPNVVVEEKQKRVSKKKQFPVVAVITPDGIEGNLLQGIRRPLIVHLPIQSKEVLMNDMPIAYNPLPPVEAEPYDSCVDNPFKNDVEYLSTNESPHEALMDVKENELSHSSIQSHNKIDKEIESSPSSLDFYNLKGSMLIQYKDTSEVKKIPETSDSACYWCCHVFSNRPVVLPIRDTGEHLIVMGNFCCPECAMSYLFDMHQDSHTRWEQLSLLNRIYRELCNGKIAPAPPRAILKLFGGVLSIQEYRQLIQSHKVRVDVHLPPMVSILATMDTKPIDFYDANITKNVSETVKERLQKAEEVLRLRRTKPLKAWESTLDACINLKIKHDSSSVS
jgi:hypothetical protein